MKKYWLVAAAAVWIGCGGSKHHVAASAPPPPPPAAVEEPRNTAPETRPADNSANTNRNTAVRPVEPPPPPPPSNEGKLPGSIEEINAQLRDVYFAYDRYDPDSESLNTLRADAQLLVAILKEFPNIRVIVEGHCDDRGSAEYNIGLGERRAGRVLEVLHEYGLPTANATIVSYGKEAPQCVQATEQCRHLNRRAHMNVQ